MSAPSGAGKTTLCKKVIESFPEIRFSISCTTRNKRVGEEHGRDYHFIDENRFREMIKDGSFAEWAKVHDKLYGTTVNDINMAINEGIDLILDIDWQGAKQIKEKIDGGVYIFILPPSIDELEKRLLNRGKDSKGTINKRIKNAKEEISHASWYDYNITNDNLEEATKTLKSIFKEKTDKAPI